MALATTQRYDWTSKTIADATKDLDVLHGYGPGGRMNPAAGDGYFANSLIRKWGMSIPELEEAVDYSGVAQRRRRAQRAYREIMTESGVVEDPGPERDPTPRRAIRMRR